MPQYLQKLSNISPLSWGMEGFLDLMLRKGTIVDILPECALLLGTGCIMLVTTGLVLKKKIVLCRDGHERIIRRKIKNRIETIDYR
jgi:ABC-type multidrug transport system permease subunit